MKKISSYNVLNGIVRFTDGEAKYFTQEATEMINRMIYLLSNKGVNFQSTLELTDDAAIDVAIDLISTEQ